MDTSKQEALQVRPDPLAFVYDYQLKWLAQPSLASVQVRALILLHNSSQGTPRTVRTIKGE